MFRGIHLNPADRDFHRFLLRGEDGQIKDYCMKRLTFGVSASPYLATQGIHEAADDLNPSAAATAKNSFYVDDYLSGADNPECTGIVESEHISVQGHRITPPQVPKQLS